MKFSTPIVCKPKDGYWFVFFRFWYEGKPWPVKISRAKGTDLNRFKDLKEREQHFKALCAARHDWLKMGWNPKTDPEFKNRDVNLNVQSWNVEQAFTHAIKNKKLAIKSYYDYNKSVEYFLTASREYGIDHLPINELKRSHIKTVFAHLMNVTKLSAKNYNKRLTHIKSLLSELVEWEALDANPAFRLKDLPVEETHKYIPLTDEEKTIIREYLSVVNPQYLVFVLTVYFTGLRPAEVLSIKIKDIELPNSVIHLQAFAAKTQKQRIATIHKNLKPYIEKAVGSSSGELYLFSENFVPGAVKMQTRYARKFWDKYVCDDLGIDKHMYALRHTNAKNLIQAGLTEEDVGRNLGHRGKLMIRAYTDEGINQSLERSRNSDIDF